MHTLTWSSCLYIVLFYISLKRTNLWNPNSARMDKKKSILNPHRTAENRRTMWHSGNLCYFLPLPVCCWCYTLLPGLLLAHTHTTSPRPHHPGLASPCWPLVQRTYFRVFWFVFKALQGLDTPYISDPLTLLSLLHISQIVWPEVVGCSTVWAKWGNMLLLLLLDCKASLTWGLLKTHFYLLALSGSRCVRLLVRVRVNNVYIVISFSMTIFGIVLPTWL